MKVDKLKEKEKEFSRLRRLFEKVTEHLQRKLDNSLQGVEEDKDLYKARIACLKQYYPRVASILERFERLGYDIDIGVQKEWEDAWILDWAELTGYPDCPKNDPHVLRELMRAVAKWKRRGKNNKSRKINSKIDFALVDGWKMNHYDSLTAEQIAENISPIVNENVTPGRVRKRAQRLGLNSSTIGRQSLRTRTNLDSDLS